MRRLSILFTLVLLIACVATARSGDEAPTKVLGQTGGSEVTIDTARVYPIAPGVWYPGDPLPEKPMRYYRVRCWPGCHRGSSYGKYPDQPLNMKAIFPTRSLDRASDRPAYEE